MISYEPRVFRSSLPAFALFWISLLGVASNAAVARAGAIDQVKQTIEKMAEASQTQDAAKLAEFFVEEDAKIFRGIDKASKDLDKKKKSLEELTRSKLGMELPGGVTVKSSGPNSAKVAKELASLDDSNFKQVGQTVVVTAGPDKKLTFVNVDGSWKIRLDDQERKVLALVSQPAAATGKYYDALIAGINDGTITKENLKKKAQELSNKIVTPVMMRVMMAVMMESRTSAKPAVAKAPAKAVEALESDPEEEPETPEEAGDPGEKLAETWADFLHYIKIARPDLAGSYGQAILDSGASPREIYLLSVKTRDSQSVLTRAMRLEGMKDIVERIRKTIEAGYEADRADPKEIANSIDMLAGPVRAYQIGKRRLKASGEYAMPQLIQKLTDPRAPGLLKERIVTVLPSIGKEAVRPLSVALQTKDPKLQEILANALGRIAYPHAAGRLKELVERKGVLARTRRAAISALIACAGKESMTKSAAWLFHDLAEKYYRQDESVVTDARYDKGNVWYWREGLGLDFKPVRREIFCDIYAMRMARLALQHDPEFYPAASLWLAAGLKKEADLPAGAVDPTRGDDQPSASYYALAAGAGFGQDVLARGLRDENSAIALGAIEALARTAGAKNLVEPVAGGATPLVEALTYSDRQVRFLAALSLANATPPKRFSGYRLVMAVLNEALRQTGKKTALLVAGDPQQRNLLKDGIRAAGYEVIDQSDVAKALAAAGAVGGVDVAVLGAKPAPSSVVATLRQHEGFAAVPIVVAASGQRVRRLVELDGRVVLLGGKITGSSVGGALKKAAALGAGEPLTGEQAADWAVRAAGAIRLLGLRGGSVFDISEAMKPLTAALNHEVAKVQIAAAGALAVMPQAEAQQAIAALAADADKDEDVRVDAFGILSESLRRYGNLLTEDQAQAVLEIVKKKDSQALCGAAAEALGAMNLPSKEIKSLIIETAD